MDRAAIDRLVAPLVAETSTNGEEPFGLPRLCIFSVEATNE